MTSERIARLRNVLEQPPEFDAVVAMFSDVTKRTHWKKRHVLYLIGWWVHTLTQSEVPRADLAEFLRELAALVEEGGMPDHDPSRDRAE